MDDDGLLVVTDCPHDVRADRFEPKVSMNPDPARCAVSGVFLSPTAKASFAVLKRKTPTHSHASGFMF